MKNATPQRVFAKVIKEFRALRIARDMTHDEVAKKSGVTRPAISHIEGGKRTPSLLTALKIADALGENLSTILRDAELHEEKKK